MGLFHEAIDDQTNPRRGQGENGGDPVVVVRMVVVEDDGVGTFRKITVFFQPGFPRKPAVTGMPQAEQEQSNAPVAKCGGSLNLEFPGHGEGEYR